MLCVHHASLASFAFVKIPLSVFPLFLIALWNKSVFIPAHLRGQNSAFHVPPGCAVQPTGQDGPAGLSDRWKKP